MHCHTYTGLGSGGTGPASFDVLSGIALYDSYAYLLDTGGSKVVRRVALMNRVRTKVVTGLKEGQITVIPFELDRMCTSTLTVAVCPFPHSSGIACNTASSSFVG